VTNLIKRPTIEAVPCIKYVVRWTFTGTQWSEETGDDPCDVDHRKVYLSKSAAYRHAAWGYITNKRFAQGCTKDKCAIGGEHGYRYCGYGEADEYDTRCKYCRRDSAPRIATRLARWLLWRDKRLAKTGTVTT
jgi:hypothetical protein